MEVGITPWESAIRVEDSYIPNINFCSTLLEKAPGSFLPPLYDPIPK
jgi:hypothetical protein